ncbi:replication endonuclease [Paraburkholderia sp. BR10923]|uniref:replication endonuclease n=1 Tax=Paraburkholderia sp. BR10923 TaxID=3236992 RepID=UPI0034CD776A
MPHPLRSTSGVDALIAHACAEHEHDLLAQVFSPLFPEDSPWTALADIPESLAQRHAPRLKAVAQALGDYRAGLTGTAGRLAKYLDATEEDIRELALRYAKHNLPGVRKLEWAEGLLGGTVPGKSVASRLARVNDARFWRRTIRTRLLREREQFFLRMRLVGTRAEAYVSDMQLATRRSQLRRQQQWMKDTVLIPRYLVPDDGEQQPLTLEQVASSAKARFAKLYTFVNAADSIAQDEGLAAAMLTLTLEPEWHPNPSFGQHSWNGASPREAHRSMASRWQSILRDLHRAGVGISGLRVVEPHKDGCPHWHVWLLYRPDAETTILATVMRYFPNKLKVRAPSLRGEKNTDDDRIFDTPAELRVGAGRPLTHANEGAQVDLARIDRSISSGPSYAMKYLLATVEAGEQLDKEVGLFPDIENEATKKEKRKKRFTARRVDAFRSLWGINAAQLFGVAKCLTSWDELRRLSQAPEHPELRRLWALARGSDQEGRIAPGAGQRGDAKGFILALGGLAACGKPTEDSPRRSIGRLTEVAVNAYGEPIERTKGVTLIERVRKRVEVGSRTNRDTGEISVKYAWRSVATVVAEVRTRLTEWIFATKKTVSFALGLAKARFAAATGDTVLA